MLFQFKEYQPYENLKFNNLGIFLKSKIAFSEIVMKIILPISLKLNSTPNTLGCYGLRKSTPRRNRVGPSNFFVFIFMTKIKPIQSSLNRAQHSRIP